MNLARIEMTGFTMGFYSNRVEASCNICLSLIILFRPVDEILLNGLLGGHRLDCEKRSRGEAHRGAEWRLNVVFN